MSTHRTIRKVFAAAAISTAIGLTSLAGSAASADGPKSKPGREALYYTIELTNATVAGSGVPQASVASAAAAPQAHEHVEFVYQKIVW